MIVSPVPCPLFVDFGEGVLLNVHHIVALVAEGRNDSMALLVGGHRQLLRGWPADGAQQNVYDAVGEFYASEQKFEDERREEQS